MQDISNHSCFGNFISCLFYSSLPSSQLPINHQHPTEKLQTFLKFLLLEKAWIVKSGFVKLRVYSHKAPTVTRLMEIMQILHKSELYAKTLDSHACHSVIALFVQNSLRVSNPCHMFRPYKRIKTLASALLNPDLLCNPWKIMSCIYCRRLWELQIFW